MISTLKISQMFPAPSGAAAYLRFLRVYADGEAADTVTWWRNDDGRCRYDVSLAKDAKHGDVAPRVVAREAIDCMNFDRLLTSAASLGALEIADDLEAFVFSNSHDVIAIKSGTDDANIFQVRTGTGIRGMRQFLS